MNAVETTALGKRYGRAWALRDCSLAVPKGAVTALVGPNGAGKSTLLHLLVGLLTPTTGEIRFEHGRPVRRARDLRRVAFVAQDKPLFPEFTVGEIIRFGQSTNDSFDTAAAHARLRDYGIAVTAKAHQLSGGQRALVALALALGKQADLLILDEPLADLDPLARQEVTGALMAVAAESGATVVMSSHILTELADTCDHLLLLNGGRLQVAGTIEELIDSHRIVTGPAELAEQLRREPHPAVHLRTTARQSTALVRREALVRLSTTGQAPTLDEIVLAYLRSPDASWLPTPVGVPTGRVTP